MSNPELTQEMLDEVWNKFKNEPILKCAACGQPIFVINEPQKDGICMECAGIIPKQV